MTTPDDRAVHESGHVVAACARGIAVRGVEVHALGGQCRIGPCSGMARLDTFLAGAAAQSIAKGAPMSAAEALAEPSCKVDRGVVVQLAAGDWDLIEMRWGRVQAVLRDRWDAVQRVARGLLRAGRLSAADAAALVRGEQPIRRAPAALRRDSIPGREGALRARALRDAPRGRPPGRRWG